MARPQAFTVGGEAPKGTSPWLIRQLEGIQQNFRVLFTDALTAAESSSSSSTTSSDEWDQIITKVIDQDVTNSTTLENDTELTIDVTEGSVWLIELLIIYSGTDGSGDYKWDIAVDAGVMDGVVHRIGMSTANAAQDTPLAMNSATSSTDATEGTLAAQALRVFKAVAVAAFTANANFLYRFAQNSAGVGTVARTEAGSILRAKRLI